MVKDVVDGNVNYILEEIIESDYGEHNLLVYPDLDSLERIYSSYFKRRLEANQEIILFLSTCCIYTDR